MGLNPRILPVLLVLVAAAVAVAVLAPYRAVDFVRSDGETVRMPGLGRLSQVSDTFDYLQIARRVHAGEGMTSRYTLVPLIPDSIDEAGHYPVLWRQPGYALLVAGAFTLAGAAEPNAMVALAAAAILALGLATFVLARRVLSPGWSFLAALWTLLTPIAVGVTDPLLATTLYAAWGAAFLAALLRVRSPLALAAVGVFLGLGILLRGETWGLIPGFLVVFFMTRDRDRVRGAALMLLVAVLTAASWNLYLLSVIGRPFHGIYGLANMIWLTDSYPDWSPFRTLATRDLTLLGFVAEHPREVFVKTVFNLARFARDLIFMPSVFLAPLFWLSVLRPAPEARARALLVGSVLSAAALALTFSPLYQTPRYLVPIVPFFAVGAAILLARLPRYSGVLAGAATLVGIVAMVGALANRPTDDSALVAARDLNRLLAHPETQNFSGDAVLLSDAAVLCAWIWDRPAVDPPLPRDLSRVRELLGETAALVTTAGLPPGIIDRSEFVQGCRAAGARVVDEGGAFLVYWPEETP